MIPALVIMDLSALILLAYAIWVVSELVKRAAQERHDLEQKLLAVLDPRAHTVVESSIEAPVGKVYYMDEEKEAELDSGT